jgi:hypothetical protein
MDGGWFGIRPFGIGRMTAPVIRVALVLITRCQGTYAGDKQAGLSPVTGQLRLFRTSGQTIVLVDMHTSPLKCSPT